MSKISVYAVMLRFPFITPKGLAQILKNEQSDPSSDEESDTIWQIVSTGG